MTIDQVDLEAIHEAVSDTYGRAAILEDCARRVRQAAPSTVAVLDASHALFEAAEGLRRHAQQQTRRILRGAAGQ